MQGRLKNRKLTTTVETCCAHCERMLQFDLTSDMVFSGITDGADPLVFIPDVDWDNFKEPNIIDAF